MIKERWPEAEVLGVDQSPEMLETARTQEGRTGSPPVLWQEQDIKDWQPQRTFDVIYSNAALHWLSDHPTLFPRLMSYLSPGGFLAVQMPGNYAAPSHTLVVEAARSGPWKETLEPLIKPPPVLPAAEYYRILAPYSRQSDTWATTYLHELEGENPVADWNRGTWLKPFLDALTEPHKSRFEAEYRRRVLEAYRPEPNGKTLFPFERVFVVACAKD